MYCSDGGGQREQSRAGQSRAGRAEGGRAERKGQSEQSRAVGIGTASTAMAVPVFGLRNFSAVLRHGTSSTRTRAAPMIVAMVAAAYDL